MKKFAIATAVAALFASSASVAAPFVWGNAYTDMLVNENATTKESQIFGIEGGVSTESTDLYGFFEVNPILENEFAKITAHSKLYKDFGVYGHMSKFSEGDFREDRYVVGAGYGGFAGEGYSIKPYVGVLRIDNTFGTQEDVAIGYAGYMVLNPGVTLSSWADARLDSEDSNKLKVAGNIGIQKDLDIVPGTYVGVFYNMAYGEMGQAKFSDSVQLRVGYHF